MNQKANNLVSIVNFRGAYFAVRAKSGLKIISLNTNFCNNQNWWILVNSTDPGNQLEWLIRQLTESEELNEMVSNDFDVIQS